MWTGDVPGYFKHLSTCRAFRDILVQGPWNLLGMHDKDKVTRDDSIWTTSDVNAYHEASTFGDMHLTLLLNGRPVSSTMMQNPDPHYAPRSLPPDEGIMGDCEPNVWIRDTSDTSNLLMLLPKDDAFFTITHLSVD